MEREYSTAISRYLATRFRQRTRIALAEPEHAAAAASIFLPEPAPASNQTLRVLPVAEFRVSFPVGVVILPQISR